MGLGCVSPAPHQVLTRSKGSAHYCSVVVVTPSWLSMLPGSAGPETGRVGRISCRRGLPETEGIPGIVLGKPG